MEKLPHPYLASIGNMHTWTKWESSCAFPCCLQCMLRDLWFWVKFLQGLQFLPRFLPGYLPPLGFPPPSAPHTCPGRRDERSLSCMLQGSQRLWKLPASLSLTLPPTLAYLFVRECPSSVGSHLGVQALVSSCHRTNHCLCCGFRLTMGAKTQQSREHVTSLRADDMH